jgi:DNA-binding response OmpR family regulator
MVWIIDRQQWPRALLRAELLERGYEAIGFVGVAEALSAFLRRRYVRPKLIIIELKDLLDGEERIRALAGLGIPTIFLVGAAEEQRAILEGLGWTVLLKRPFTIDRVMEEVERQMRLTPR